MTAGAHYAAALAFGGRLAAVHAEPGGPVMLSMVEPEAAASPDEARRLAAELLCAASVADEEELPQ